MTIPERSLEDDWLEKLTAYTDEEGFNELIAFAEKVCLSKPFIRPQAQAVTAQSRIIERTGLRGLRAALEVQLGAEGNDDFTDATGFVSSLKIGADTPVRYPTAFSGVFNYSQAATIEAFGHALLEEAYQVLGSDADAQVDAFLQATDAAGQIEVLRWLDKRACAIAKDEHGILLNAEALSLHPTRLSPKLMGVYPTITLPPTCLGVSLLTASFLEKAGATYLHGGVMVTRHQHEMKIASIVLGFLESLALKKFNCFAPEYMRNALANKIHELEEGPYQENTYHAMVLVRLRGGEWYQLDPNLELSGAFLFKESHPKLDRYYDTLNSLKDSAPGLELAADIEAPGLLSILTAFLQLTEPEMLISSKGLIMLVSQCGAESLADTVLNNVVRPFFYAQRDKEFDEVTRFVFDRTIKEEEGEPSVLQYHFQKVFTKYVLGSRTCAELMATWEDIGSFTESLCAIRFLPFFTLVSYITVLLQSKQDYEQHQTFELGLPRHRIGAAVLSDFGSHYDFGLSPGFWLNTWCSLVPISETLPLPAHTRRQQIMRRNLLLHTDSRKLTYLSSAGIIAESLPDY